MIKSLKKEGYILIGLYNKIGRIRTFIRRYLYKILGNKILEIVGSNYKTDNNQLILNTPNIEKLLKIGDLLNIDF